MRVHVLGLKDSALRLRYDRLFAECPGAFVQQSTAWAEVIGEVGPDRPFFLLCEDGGEDVAGLPLYLFQHREGNILTSVPQPGPLGGVFAREDVTAERRVPIYAALLEEALALGQREECLALTIITNPFAPDTELYQRAKAPDFVLHSYTQAMDLERTMHRTAGQRHALNRARKFGFRVDLCEASDLPAWYALHCQRQTALGALPLDGRIVENIFGRLVPEGKAAFMAARDQDRIASACLYVLHRRVLDVYGLSMDSHYADHAPNALVTQASVDWARGIGVKFYNWQGSPSRSSGVYRHKELWGSIELPYEFLTWLLVDRGRLAKLTPGIVRKEYPGHYVLPFAALSEGLDRVHFHKP